ncbi:MAG TPA: CdaR family protein [Polyangiales bacterium]|nr:CdaR family protein [Polyangiales bacterium]
MNEHGGHFDRGLLAQLAFGHYRLKLLAVAASIALYLLVHDSLDTQRVIDYDVLAVLPANNTGKVLVSSLPGKVRVTLRGPKAAINALEPARLKPIPIDLRNYSEPTFAFDERLIAVPHRIQVVRVQPSQVRLAWRPRARRTIPARVQLVGTPHDGFASVIGVIGPTVIEISGPDDEIAAAGNLITEQVSVAGLSEGTHELPAIRAELPGHLAYSGAIPVRVRVAVGPTRPAPITGDVNSAKSH